MLTRRTTAIIIGVALIALAGFLIVRNLRQGAVVDDLANPPAVPSMVVEPDTVPIEASFVRADETTLVAAVEQSRRVGPDAFIERSERTFALTDKTQVLRLYRYPDQTTEELPTRPSDIRPGERLIVHVPADQKDSAIAQAVRIYIASY